MKRVIKKVISSSIQNDFIWNSLNKTVLKAAQFTDIERDKFERECKNKAKQGVIYDVIQKEFPDLVVKHGSFAGMKYPEMESVGSALFPKLLGSYEKELEQVLDQICKQNYTEIVDIGCAEGYYAVGLAMRIKTAKVYAFDTDEQAINLCKKMAKLNEVTDRIFTGEFCDETVLRNIPFTEKGLIVSDCEGYEKELFKNDIGNILQNHDLLIETHDFIDIAISNHIYQIFEQTHNIKVIESIDDIKKAKIYNYKELEKYDLPTRRILLAEGRPSIMEWLFIQSKKSLSNQ